MFNRQNLLIVIVAIVGAALGLLASTLYNHPADRAPPPGVSVLKIGDDRIDLALTDLTGKLRHLREFDGKLVLVNFWASWCGPCREEMPLLDATRAQLAGQGLEIVGIAIDDADPVKAFLEDSPVRYPILLASAEGIDPSLRFGDTRSVLPYSVLIGRNGKILAQRAGNFSERGLAAWLAPHL
jgi:thiol-disulfide isomerase/thioredoxin